MNTRKTTSWIVTGFLTLVLVQTGYSQQTNSPAIGSEDLLAGNWTGSWVSCKNGHHGKLRATFCRINDTQVQAVFTGSFARILPFRYKATLTIVHEEPGLIRLRGSQRLGPIMGTFCYEATITGDRFDATYSSRRDCGQWTMTRCCECCQ